MIILFLLSINQINNENCLTVKGNELNLEGNNPTMEMNPLNIVFMNITKKPNNGFLVK